MNLDPPSDRTGALEMLHSVAESPAAYAQAWKTQTGGRVVGTFCSYVPDEVILAAGALPFRVLQVPGEFSRADGCLQAYACCLARGALELGLSGDGLSFLDGMIFSNTCDTMQCLADIWSANVGGRWVEAFMMPVYVNHAGAREYVAAEVERLISAAAAGLETSIDAASLREAIIASREARRALARLQVVQMDTSPVLTPRQYYDAVMARWVLPPDAYAALIATALDDAPVLERTSPRVVIAGGPMYAPSLPDLLGELGACWVADDLCTSGRAAWPGPDAVDDPVAAIAERLLTRSHCPTKHAPGGDPGAPVVETARRADADGVIVYRLKFCEPHAFDTPRVEQALDQAGLPHLLVEVETPSSSLGQLRTRVQAFLEMLADAPASETRA